MSHAKTVGIGRVGVRTESSLRLLAEPTTEDFVRAQRHVFERYGVEARPRFVEVPVLGGRGHVLVAGEGPPVVMVIGAPPPAAFWAPLMAQLQGFTLYAMDLPGIGLTDPMPFTTARLRESAVAFLEQVLDALGLDRPPFVANSMGGRWASWLALDRPERVAAISFVACPALLLGTSAPLPMRLLSVPSIARVLTRLMPPSERQVAQMGRMVRDELSPEIRGLLLACERLPAHSRSLSSLLHSVLTPRGARSEVTLTAEQLGALTQPVQLIWGEDEPFGSREVAERAVALIPDAELHMVPGGHAPWLSDATPVARLVAPFLRRHSATAPAGSAAQKYPRGRASELERSSDGGPSAPAYRLPCGEWPRNTGGRQA